MPRPRRTALLAAIGRTAEIRARAEHEFRAALLRAEERHSLSEMAQAAGLTRSGVRYLLRREKGLPRQ